MINGNTPAAPIMYKWKADALGKAANTGYEADEFSVGLTKREYFAGLAPDNIPRWFHQKFAETADKELTWHTEGSSLRSAECGWTQKGEIALYFAWRTYYADALLKELAK